MKPKFIYTVATDHIKCESFVLGFESEADIVLAIQNHKQNTINTRIALHGKYRTKEEAIKEAREWGKEEWPWRYEPYRNNAPVKELI